MKVGIISSPSEMCCTTLNSSIPSKPTILKAHGLFCSHLESSMVTPYLQDYHVLLVDLPEHSHPVETPLSFASAIASLVQAIKKHSPTSKVHIVGVSLGGHIALELAHLHPELVSSVFASGCSPISGSKKWLGEHPLVMYALAATVMKTDWLYWWTSNQMGMLKHEELHGKMKKKITVGLVRRGFGGLLEIRFEHSAGIKDFRTLVTAGEKGDDVEGTREMRRLLKKRYEQSMAFMVPQAGHG